MAGDCAPRRRRSVVVGYEEQQQRRESDEQIRAFVGERLAELPAADVDAFSPEERGRYDRVLLRCEFLNQQSFRVFDLEPTPERLAAVQNADAELKAAAEGLAGANGGEIDQALKRIEEAFDKRDAAMTLA